jgi:riboflavin transporter
MKKPSLQQLAFIGLLVAIGVLLGQLVSITLPNPASPLIKFGIGYLPIIVVSVLYGPVYGAFAGLAQDLLGFFLIGGPLFGQTFHPGFTLNAVIYGILPGLVFARSRAKEQRLYTGVNYAVLVLFLLLSGLYVFDIDIIVTTLSNEQKYWLVGIAFVSALILAVFNFLTGKKTGLKYPPVKILFVVTVLYMVVSLVLTPIWLYLMNPAISIWARLPLRIVKMPIEIIAYVLLLTPLFQTLDKLIHKLDE